MPERILYYVSVFLLIRNIGVCKGRERFDTIMSYACLKMYAIMTCSFPLAQCQALMLLSDAEY